MSLPFRADGGLQSTTQASWGGATGVPGLYYNTGSATWMARKPDNSETAFPGAGSSTGNWSFSGGGADLSSGTSMFLGSTAGTTGTATAIIIGQQNGATVWLGSNAGSGTSTIRSFVNWFMDAQAATSGTTLQSAPTLNMRPHYWNGTTDTTYAFVAQAVMDSTGPLAHLGYKWNGTEMFQFTNAKAFNIGVNGSIGTISQAATNTTSITLSPNVADGATSVGVAINNGTTLSTAGWKLIRLLNNGTEFAGFGGSQLAAGGLRVTADGSAFLDMSLNGATNIGYGSNYIGIGSGSCIFNGQGPRSDGTTTIGTSANPWPSSFVSRPVVTNQIIAAASSITVNPASGDYVRINLGATAITSLTISAGQNGEEMVVEVVEDATGTRTIPTTWTNVAFAGGTYTATATANKHDCISLMYNSTLAKWCETGRALNMS